MKVGNVIEGQITNGSLRYGKDPSVGKWQDMVGQFFAEKGVIYGRRPGQRSFYVVCLEGEVIEVTPKEIQE